MVVMLHHNGKSAQLYRVKNLSVNSDGFCCELDRTPDELRSIVEGLKSPGFEAELIGRLVSMPLSGFSVFDETTK